MRLALFQRSNTIAAAADGKVHALPRLDAHHDVQRRVERTRQLGRRLGGAACRVRAVDADDDLVHSISPWIRRVTSAGGWRSV